MKIGEGYKCGKLSVISDSGKRKNGYIIWKCLCECGNMTEMDTRTLQRGLQKDCGCETKVRPGQRDITGMRFGRLTALEPTEKRDCRGATVWHCLCDCGKEIDTSMAQLINGYRKSCGCIRRSFNENLTGQKFGNLTVLEKADRRNGQLYWKCQCSCGKETTVRGSYLLEGRTKSCGCLQAQSIIQNMKYLDGTSVRMLENAPKRLNNTNSSGYNGIYYNRKNSKWIAQITFKKKTYYLGSYFKIEDAVLARKRAEERIYGEFLDWYYQQVLKKE